MRNFSPDKASISAIIITRNEEGQIRECLESLSLCEEIILVDSFSDDATVEIAREMGAKVTQREFRGFGDQKSFALSLASCDWVISLDADERLTPELQAEIRLELKQPRAQCYRIPRLSQFLGRSFYHSGWWPDQPLRLFRRGAAEFNQNAVHESLMSTHEAVVLTEPMVHLSIRSLQQALSKSTLYSTLGAKAVAEKKRRPKLTTAAVHGLGAFFKTYVLKRGFLDGREGFLNALIHAQTIFWKYAIAWEVSR